MVQLLIVKTDGEVHKIESDKTFRDILNPDECYIINNDEQRVIYLWKGSQCSVRKKFIGAQKSQEVRGQVGMHYKVVPIDEGDEPQAVLDILDEVPGDGFAKEIIEEEDLKFEVPGVNVKSGGKKESKKKAAKKDLQKKASKARARFGQGAPSAPVGGGGADGAKQVMTSAPKYDNAGPLYSGGQSTQSAQPQQQPVTKEISVDFKKIMETLESLEIPAGYEREMIIIGNQAYSIVEKKVSFLGNDQVEKVMEKVGSLPEGVFFAEGYTPRVLCEDQKVLSIEFLKSKQKGGAQGKPKKKLKAKAKDPKELAKEFGMNV
ncbi:MAG: hypothetical protein GF364_02010 [Candidatus Lokiarchaeota archaeon]|nr:hypothetical protein [Candidatus Lokiarchaeota archaeon]